MVSASARQSQLQQAALSSARSSKLLKNSLLEPMDGRPKSIITS
jgi:hypothetical protein